jgi:hypothetical protein
MSASHAVLEEILKARQGKGALPAAPTPAPAQEAPSEPVADGEAPTTNGTARDSRGRFGKGNRFGRGNPFARRLAAMREAALAAVSEEQLAELFKALYRKALAGDAGCAKVLLLYLIGKPAAAVDPDTLDLEEWRQLEASPTGARLFRVLSDCVAPADACEEANSDAQAEALMTTLARKLANTGFPEELKAEREARVGR